MNKKPNYDYETILLNENPNDVLKRWNYPGTEKLEKDLINFYESKSKTNDDIESLINKIVLWKLNRQVIINVDLLDEIMHFEEKDINSFPSQRNDPWWQKVESIINSLVKCDGVRIAMASTILHFFHPSTFQIIDQRSYRVIFRQEMPYSSKDWGKIYVDYMLKCIEYYNNIKHKVNFNFMYFDRYTYQLDIEIGNGIKY